MEIDVLLSLLSDYNRLKENIITEKLAANAAYYSSVGIDKSAATAPVPYFLKQYDTRQHDIFDRVKRPDTIVTIVTGTNPQTGEPIEGTKLEPVARIAIPFQKMIVSRAVSFLCGNPIEISATAKPGKEQDLLDSISKVWEDNKLDYDSKKLAEIMMSETEVAELWYVEDAKEAYWDNTSISGAQKTLRMKLLANSLGDKMYPVWNEAGDMIAFARQYYKALAGNVTEEHFDIYTDGKIYLATNTNGKGWEMTPYENTIGKIPVIYYNQKLPEWHDVQTSCDRVEVLISNLADSNDYTASPTVLVKGLIKGFSAKGEQGKVLELDEQADAKYLEATNSPQSVELELNKHFEIIFNHTDTPRISEEDMKGMGVFSGTALKCLFLPGHLKASRKEETFGKSMQRRLNFLKAAMIKIAPSLSGASNLRLKPVFHYYTVVNDQERIDMLTTAVSNGILSHKTAIKQNPFVEDADAEEKQIEAEQQKADSSPTGLNNLMNKLNVA